MYFSPLSSLSSAKNISLVALRMVGSLFSISAIVHHAIEHIALYECQKIDNA
ncbi:hypothetical protein HC931_16535 [Candidatus Gracilibacteria bacterium]|nr:hypothetical protein [Candidatus Gracilibacteria bacterium]NJM87942.1 hypothetical protein [Hydrococcus sp. RU_2_2]NJP21185.1 hypothetical protein [Hydrococcus sp. CRU_1_1]